MGRGAFAHGQTYVALSRCRTLEGITLTKPISPQHLFTDWRVIRFITAYQYGLSERRLPLEEKLGLIRRAIRDGQKLHITYLKASDEKSRRTIEPRAVGEMEYEGKTFIGLEAYCLKRKDRRVFRADWILDLRPV